MVSKRVEVASRLGLGHLDGLRQRLLMWRGSLAGPPRLARSKLQAPETRVGARMPFVTVPRSSIQHPRQALSPTIQREDGGNEARVQSAVVKAKAKYHDLPVFKRRDDVRGEVDGLPSNTGRATLERPTPIKTRAASEQPRLIDGVGDDDDFLWRE